MDSLTIDKLKSFLNDRPAISRQALSKEAFGSRFTLDNILNPHVKGGNLNKDNIEKLMNVLPKYGY